MPTIADLEVQTTATLIPARTTVAGVGVPILLIDIDSGDILGATGSQKLYVGSPSAIIEAMTADQGDGDMSATDLARAVQMVSQYRAPGSLLIAAYDSTATPTAETPATAMDRVVSGGNAYTGVVTCSNPTTAVVAALATWRAVGVRRQRYLQVEQSAEASLVTSSPTSDLDPLAAVPGTRLIAHSSATVPIAAAEVGWVASYPLATGPIGTRYQIPGLNLSTYTAAELAQAKANNCAIYADLSEVSGPAQRLTSGQLDYSGTEWSAWISLVYSLAVARAAVIDLIALKSQRGEKLDRGPRGRQEVAGTIAAALQPLADAGHYEPGVIGSGSDAVVAPDGFLVTPSLAGTAIACRVQLRIPGAATGINLNFEGEVIA